MKLFIDRLRHKRYGSIFIGVSDKGLRYVGIGKDASYNTAIKYAIANNLIPERNSKKTERYVRQFKKYLDGDKKNFSFAIDLVHLPAFTRKVLHAALNIPYGKIITYGDLARRVGSPKAARAVGRVMATNPIPIVIPCHRVVGADGSLTGYGGGLAMKKRLLQLEKSLAVIKQH